MLIPNGPPNQELLFTVLMMIMFLFAGIFLLLSVRGSKSYTTDIGMKVIQMIFLGIILVKLNFISITLTIGTILLVSILAGAFVYLIYKFLNPVAAYIKSKVIKPKVQETGE